MTLNILFLTITINKRNKSQEQILREEAARKHYEDTKERQYTVHRLF